MLTCFVCWQPNAVFRWFKTDMSIGPRFTSTQSKYPPIFDQFPTIFSGFVCSDRPAGSRPHASVPSCLWCCSQSPAPEAAGSCPRPQRGPHQNPKRWGEDGTGELVSMETVQLGGNRDDHHKEGQVRGNTVYWPLTPHCIFLNCYPSVQLICMFLPTFPAFCLLPFMFHFLHCPPSLC